MSMIYSMIQPVKLSTSIISMMMLVVSFFYPCSPIVARALNFGSETISGVVFHDMEETGYFNPGIDAPLPGVAVSNGRDIVLTDENGRYELAVSDHTIIFVIKPANWAVPVDSLQIPRFYHIHSPYGAEGRQYSGLGPMPPLREPVNFPLVPAREPDKFDVLIFADTQPRNKKELHYLARDAVEELTGSDAAFGITLGDLVFDDLDLFDPLNHIISKIGIPWRHIIGNHDLDFSADNNTGARGAYYRHYGPSYYSFAYGPAHFIVLDNNRFIIDADNRYYRPELNESQLAFVENELSRLDKDKLLILLMHIPWDDGGWNIEQREKLLGLLSDHPNALSLGAHWHRHYHRFLGEDFGFNGEGHHHMVSVGAVSGAWWRGMPDEYGIPHAMMSDGTPAGYGVLHVNGQEAKLHWQSSRRQPGFQMHIHAPGVIRSEETENMTITANIFNAMPDANVKMRIGENGPWVDMERKADRDPVRLAAVDFEEKMTGLLGDDVPWLEMGGSANSYKLWQAKIPEALDPGIHLIHVRSMDRWWRHDGNKIIRVVY